MFVRNREKLWEKVEELASIHIGDDYNYPTGIERKGKSFCSELIVKIYNQLGVNCFRKAPHKTIPAHLELLINNSNEWLDVTDVYKKNIDHISEEKKNLIIDIVVKGDFLTSLKKDPFLKDLDIEVMLDDLLSNTQADKVVEIVEKVELYKNGKYEKFRGEKKRKNK
ncbi:hypothetical protein J7E95_26585 [Streptomyces sp. ISL-14]|nr:hypothetical protein [Streptomyces sp. ISL-14]